MTVSWAVKFGQKASLCRGSTTGTSTRVWSMISFRSELYFQLYFLNRTPLFCLPSSFLFSG